jgi:hypothetical protein
MENLAGKITGGSVTAAEWNQLPTEVQNLIVAAGMALTNGDLDQLGKAVATYSAMGQFYTGSGPADVYVATKQAGFQAPPSYFTGMVVRFRPSATNTGAATVDVDGLGAKTIKREDGSVLMAGDLDTDKDAYLRYDGTDFLLSNGSAGIAPSAAALTPGFLYGLETSRAFSTRFTVASGSCADSTNAQLIALGSSINKDIGVAGWASGTNNSGQPTGVTFQSGDWYPVFMIYRNSDGAVDVGIDIAANAGTASLLLTDSGYDLFRRIGWIKGDTGGFIEEYTQIGDHFQFNGLPTSGRETTSDPGSGTTVRMNCPPMRCIIGTTIRMESTSAALVYAWVTPDGVDPGTPAAVSHSADASDTEKSTKVISQTDSGGNCRMETGGATVNLFNALGDQWWDPRGKNGEV